MSLVGRTHVFDDEVLDAHKEWFLEAISGYRDEDDDHGPDEDVVHAWLERVRTELTPRQRVQLLIFVAYRYRGWDNNINAHVTSALFHQVDETYAFLILAWVLYSYYNEHRHGCNEPSVLLPILLNTYFGHTTAVASQALYDRLEMRHFDAYLWHYWGRPSSANGRLLSVLREEDTSWQPRAGGPRHTQLAQNWDTCVRQHLKEIDATWQADTSAHLHRHLPNVLAHLVLAYVPPLVIV
jgi:hypothetical protein